MQKKQNNFGVKDEIGNNVTEMMNGLITWKKI